MSHPAIVVFQTYDDDPDQFNTIVWWCQKCGMIKISCVAVDEEYGKKNPGVAGDVYYSPSMGKCGEEPRCES
jgi:hypothetical protein